VNERKPPISDNPIITPGTNARRETTRRLRHFRRPLRETTIIPIEGGMIGPHGGGGEHEWAVAKAAGIAVLFHRWNHHQPPIDEDFGNGPSPLTPPKNMGSDADDFAQGCRESQPDKHFRPSSQDAARCPPGAPISTTGEHERR